MIYMYKNKRKSYIEIPYSGIWRLYNETYEYILDFDWFISQSTLNDICYAKPISNLRDGFSNTINTQIGYQV